MPRKISGIVGVLNLPCRYTFTQNRKHLPPSLPYQSISVIMANMNKKRERENKDSIVRNSKKRQKRQLNDSRIHSSEEIVSIDDLAWKEVTLPGRLDDAEGFFGLEEIDGVDIQRPQGGGEVKFKVRVFWRTEIFFL